MVLKLGKVFVIKVFVLGEEVVEEKRDEVEVEFNRGIGGIDCGNWGFVDVILVVIFVMIEKFCIGIFDNFFVFCRKI